MSIYPAYPAPSDRAIELHARLTEFVQTQVNQGITGPAPTAYDIAPCRNPRISVNMFIPFVIRNF